jgi:hypothetical protein
MGFGSQLLIFIMALCQHWKQYSTALVAQKYWTRDFDKPEYDYENPGWKFVVFDTPGDKLIYNTTLPGYGNYGHYFGDKLTGDERKAVIEYLKTL